MWKQRDLDWLGQRGREGGSNFEVGANIGTELVNDSSWGLSCITQRRPANFKYDKQQLVNNLFSLPQINAFRAICLHSFCDIDLTVLEEA